jgi:Fe(3+) dicitrate transport protein
LPDIKTTRFFLVKKNEVVGSVKFRYNNAREIFSLNSGVNIWENEGSGIQINVGVRGLSPNRSWELNTDKATTFLQTFLVIQAYYNPPMEAVETRIGSWWRIVAVWSTVWWYVELCP